MAFLPEAESLRRVRWQIFATLTFRHCPRCAQRRRAKLRAWLRQIAKRRAYFPKLLFCARLEGEPSTSCLHYHVIVGGLSDVPTNFLSLADAKWKQLGGGFTRIEHFDPSRDGVGYILKAPPGYGRSHRVQDDDIYIPTLSLSVLALLRSKQRG